MARVICVGDPHQCHPVGTSIALTNGVVKAIEDIKINDELVTYNSKKSYFPGVNNQGRKVKEFVIREFTGELISISTKTGYFCEYTPNHKCFVKFNGVGKYCLYLMIKGSSARVGICRLNYKNGFGVGIRCRSEKADFAWVLAVLDTEREAKIEEILVSSKFGLPQIIFTNRGQLFPQQSFIDDVYNKIGNNLIAAQDCLESYGRNINYPIWQMEHQLRFGKLKQNYIGSKKTFITQACNLISGFMEVRTFDGTTKGGSWEIFSTSKRSVENIKVYSIELEATEDDKKIYIANGIVTHNSLYRFRGADCEAFNRIGQMLAKNGKQVIRKELPINYRSDQLIIKHAQQWVPNLRGNSKALGTVSSLMFGEAIERANNNGKDIELPDGIDGELRSLPIPGKQETSFAFLCRINLPLIVTAYQLISQGKRCCIIGRNQIGQPLKNIIETICGTDTNRISDKFDSDGDIAEEGLMTRLSKYHRVQSAKLQGEGYENKLEVLHQNVECIEVIAARVLDDKISSLLTEIDTLFVEDPAPGVISLSTIHRSKGLEWDVVFILRPDLLPHPLAKPNPDGSWSDEQQQEANCCYVGSTRPRHRLYYVANWPFGNKSKFLTFDFEPVHNDEKLEYNGGSQPAQPVMEASEDSKSTKDKFEIVGNSHVDDGEPF